MAVLQKEVNRLNVLQYKGRGNDLAIKQHYEKEK